MAAVLAVRVFDFATLFSTKRVWDEHLLFQRRLRR